MLLHQTALHFFSEVWVSMAVLSVLVHSLALWFCCVCKYIWYFLCCGSYVDAGVYFFCYGSVCLSVYSFHTEVMVYT